MTATTVRKRSSSEAFRFVLRRSTTVDHEALDRHPAFAALRGGTLSLDGYCRLMSLFHEFYVLHDPVIEQACRVHRLERLGFDYAPRSGILEDDLTALGASPAPATRSSDLSELAPIRFAGSLAGMLYVIEGSMLGGGVLCRAVEALLARHGASGDGYWQWCRHAGGARWAMTCGMIEALSSDNAARADMVTGAQATFATFADSLVGWQNGLRHQDPGLGAWQGVEAIR